MRRNAGVGFETGVFGGMKNRMFAAAAMAAMLAPAVAPAAETQVDAKKEEGSLYLQCDGNPNNMTAGESAARLLGAVTLLGLFAPPPESADASKRKFGADGAAACSGILEGEKAEGNPRRRIPLILARAVHQIEAKDYAAAGADVAKARAEADAAQLTADPYFNRSMGLSFDQVEAAILVRQDRVPDAMRVALAATDKHRFSLLPLISMQDYAKLAPLGSDADIAHVQAVARLAPGMTDLAADRLEEIGRYGEAARMRADLVRFQSIGKTKEGEPLRPSTLAVAQLALSEALAGDWDAAAAAAKRARSIDDARVGEGKPEAMDVRLQTTEVLDLYEVLLLAKDGKPEAARRQFTARSRWLAPSFGAVMAANRLLYADAPAADRVAQLTQPADAMWAERATAARAELTAKDSDNKTLFQLIEPYVAAAAFEAQSKSVWRTDKSKIFIKLKSDDALEPETKIAFLYGVQPDVAYDSMMLHAALDAKAQGKQGFTFAPLFDKYLAAVVRAGSPGDEIMPASLYLDADAVIAALSPAIPDPVTLKARRAGAK